MAEEIQDPPWPRSTGIYTTRQSFCVFPPKQNLDPSHPLSPLVALHDLGPAASQLHSSSLCPFKFHLINVPQRNALGRFVCLCQSRKVNRRGTHSLSTKIPYMLQTEMGMEAAQKRRVKRLKSEPANVVLRTKRMKDPRRKKKGVGVEETTKMTSIDKPIREKMIVTTDENGRLKCPSSDSG